MKNRSISLVLVTLTFFFVTQLAEARLGGGRSSGFRGGRGFQSRPAPSAPYRSEAARPYGQQPPLGQGAPFPSAPRSSWGGGMMRGVVAGLAGGFLGSMLFRGLGIGAPGAFGGGGGIGFLEILFIAAVGFFLFRWLRQRSSANTPAFASGASRSYEAPPRYAPQADFTSEPVQGEDAVSESLRRYDGAFDLKRFKEARVDDFFALQAAFSNRDLGAVRERVAPELFSTLENDITQLRQGHRINKLENIAVRDTELVEGWQEVGKEFATLRLTANVVDYTVDDRTGELIAGSKSDPVKFDEYWTYVRDIGFAAQSSQWRLSAIEQANA